MQGKVNREGSKGLKERQTEEEAVTRKDKLKMEKAEDKSRIDQLSRKENSRKKRQAGFVANIWRLGE